MKKIKKDFVIFIIIFCMALIIFHPYLLGHYASDTYNVVNQGYEKYAIEWNLKDGRVFLALSVLTAGLLNLPIEFYVFITLLIAIVISCITVIKLKNIIETYKPASNLLMKSVITLIAFVTIFNFMYVENLYFIECGMMALSILLYLLAANLLVNRDKKYFIKAAIYVILGVFSYQGTIGFLFAMTALLSFLKNTEKPYKETFKNLIFSGIIALIAVGLNLIQVKITSNILQIEQSRIDGIEGIFDNLVIVFSNIPNVLMYTINLFPRYGLIVFTISIFLITSFALATEKNSKKIIPLLITIIITIASSFVIFIMTVSSFYTGRMHFCIGALIGIMLIYMYVHTSVFEKEKLTQYTIIAFILLYFCINVFSQLHVQYEHLLVNKLEKQEVQKIDEYITKYENENNIKVTKIVPIYTMNEDKTYYEQITQRGQITVNALKCTWSYDGVINFYTGRNLKNILNKKVIPGNDKDTNQEEYFCIDDILFVNIYKD